jgi:hypothetical protein
VTGERRRRHAAVLLLVTAVLWLHQWLPAILVGVWVAWLILHKRLEGSFGDTLIRLWRRAWPPPAWVLAPLLAVNALAYWFYAPDPAKLLLVALNVLALSILLWGRWWPLPVRVERSWTVRPASGPGPGSPAVLPPRGAAP